MNSDPLLPAAQWWSDPLRFLDFTFSDASENVMADERLLDEVDRSGGTGCLRIWEQATPAVILGRSNDAVREVHVAACETDCIPIIKRCSGGGAVVLGRGCLCYALVLPIDERHRQAGISNVTAEIMRRLAAAFSQPEKPVTVHGVSDLVVDHRKFSGNSQRWRRRALLHHGTILYDYPLELITRYLQFPSRTPTYRGERTHADFVGNLHLNRNQLVDRLKSVWRADGGLIH